MFSFLVLSELFRWGVLQVKILGRDVFDVYRIACSQKVSRRPIDEKNRLLKTCKPVLVSFLSVRVMETGVEAESMHLESNITISWVLNLPKIE